MRNKRPSKSCLKGCDGIGCYDLKTRVEIDGKKYTIWLSRCKKRMMFHRDLPGQINHLCRIR